VIAAVLFNFAHCREYGEIFLRTAVMVQAVDEKIPDKGAGYMIRLVAVALAAKWLVDTGKMRAIVIIFA
jgi:hypothetical protein